MSTQDEALLTSYGATGDADCFAELISRHRDMVYSTTARLLPDGADAEDATQETFLRLARSARQVRTSVSAWLHRTAVNAAVDALRKDRSRRTREREVAAVAANQQQEASWDDLKAEIDLAIDSLPDDLRQPVVLCYLEGKTQVAAGEELGVSQATVSARAKKGIEQVRERLKQAGVVVSALALAGLLTENAVHAAPASVVANLAKLAVAGIKPAAPTGWVATLGATISGSLAAKVALGVLAVCAIGTAAYRVTRNRPTEPPRTDLRETRRDAPAGGRGDASDGRNLSTAGRGSVPMEPTFVDRPAFAVMGVLNSGDPTALDYADIWGNQFASRAMEIGPVATERNTYGLYFETEQEGVVEMVAGMAVPIGTEAPEGLVVRNVPAATYAVVGCTLAEISETWQAIETEWIPASGYEVDLCAASFYLSPPEATGAPDSPLTIYVPVVKKDG